MTRRHTRTLAGLAGAALVVSLAPMGAQAKDTAPPAHDAKASPQTQGPPVNPPSHGDPTNPAQPRT